MNDDAMLPASETQALPAADDLSLPPGGVELLTEETINQQAAMAEQLGETLSALQSLITRHSERFDELRNEIKEIRDSLRNLFDNDADLQTLEAQAKTVTTDLKQKQQRIKESPEAVQLQMKIKELQDETKDIQDTLNNHLLRYYQITGSQVIEEADGTEREFSVQARLKGKKKAE